MDYYANITKIKLCVLIWKDVYNALFDFFFKVKNIEQDSIFSLRKGKKWTIMKEREKKEKGENWANRYKHTFEYVGSVWKTIQYS